MTSIILEDEKMASNRLKRMLLDIDQGSVVQKVFTSIKDTVDHLKNHPHPDVLFLDIHVSDGNSFELLKAVRVKSKVIFTTAFDQYAVQAFREKALDYLLKPIKKDQLVEALSRIDNNADRESEDSANTKDRFLIKFGKKLKSIKVEEVAYVYSKNKITYFYSKDGQRIPSDFKLQDVELDLDSDMFMRVNRQFIVHIDSISDMTRYDSSRLKLSLNPPIDTDIIISTERTRVFKKWIDR